MVGINRSASPRALLSPSVQRAFQAIQAIVAARPVKSADFVPCWNEREVRRALYEMQFRKCAYCERLRDETRESDIDHFRPKVKYWWLAYVWDNLLFSCRHCNQEHKKDEFPLADDSNRARTPQCDLTREQPMLINPGSEDPERCLRWNWNDAVEPGGAGLAFIEPTDERSRSTIAALGLNRGELPRERGRVVLRMEALITKYRAARYVANRELENDAIEDIRREVSAESEFLGVRRAMLRAAGLGWVI